MSLAKPAPISAGEIAMLHSSVQEGSNALILSDSPGKLIVSKLEPETKAKLNEEFNQIFNEPFQLKSRSTPDADNQLKHSNFRILFRREE